MPEPFILLDDARVQDAADARLYRGPVQVVVARRPEEVQSALEELRTLSARGLHLAGYIAYEAGLSLEPRLAPLATRRTGADGPLVWFGAFEHFETIAANAVPAWLAGNGGSEPSGIGPLDPSVLPGDYEAAFAAIQDAIRAGDIYQANLTLPLAGSWHGDALALYGAIRPAARAGYGGIVHDGTHWLLSFSPELFFSLKGSEAKCKPMKGTRPRGSNEAEDEALARELAGSVKDRAENLMIVELLRTPRSTP
jgi:para-aminobenzoate synthetase / 4-amino-4-deoxychorismate lyase